MNPNQNQNPPYQPPQPQPTPLPSPIDSTPPPASGQPTPTPPPQKVVSKGMLIKFILAIIVIIITGFFFAAQDKKEEDLMKNGVKVEGISNGKYVETSERSGKYSRDTVYKAWYEFDHQDGFKSRTIGDKLYEDASDIVAGKKATIYYDPNDAGKGTVVTDEP